MILKRMNKDLLKEAEKDNSFLRFINRTLDRDPKLFSEYILSKNNLKRMTIIFIFFLSLNILNLVLLISLINYEQNFQNNFNSNDNLTRNLSLKEKTKDFHSFKNLKIYSISEGIYKKRKLPKNRVLLNYTKNSILEQSEMKDSMNTSILKEDVIYPLNQNKSLPETNHLVKIIYVTSVLLSIKLLLYVIGHLIIINHFKNYKNINNNNFYFQMENKKTKNFNLKKKIPKNKFTVLFDIINSNKITNSKPDLSSCNFEGSKNHRGDIVVHNRSLEDDIKKKFLNNKMNLMFIISISNIFDLFYQFQLLLKSIFQLYFTDSKSIDIIITYIYFFIFYILVLILYVSQVDMFYENILLGNFLSFFILYLIDGFFYKNPQLNFLSFFLFWIFLFFIIKKNTLNKLKIFSYEKIIIESKNFTDRDIFEESNIGILILNIEKEIETSNFIFDEILNEFQTRKIHENEEALASSNQKEKRKQENKNLFYSGNFILKENLILTEKYKYLLKEGNLYDKEVIENNCIFQRNNLNFSQGISNLNINNKSEINNIINEPNDNHKERSNKFLTNNKSFIFNNENSIFASKNYENTFNEKNFSDKYHKKLFLINHEKFLQILYEMEEPSFMMNLKLLEKHQIIIKILENLNKNNIYLQTKLKNDVSSFKKKMEIEGKIPNNLCEYKEILNRSKENQSYIHDPSINNSFLILNINNNHNNFKKDLLYSSISRLKPPQVINRLDNQNNKGHKSKIDTNSIDENQLKLDFKEYLIKTEKLCDELYTELKAFINLVTIEINKNKNFSIFIGNLVHKDIENERNNLILSIKLIQCQKSKNIILKMIDTTDIINFQQNQSEIKFKNLFLKKFSHEFKNPLLNISEICDNFYQTCKFSSKINLLHNNKGKSPYINSNFSSVTKHSCKSLSKSEINDIKHCSKSFDKYLNKFINNSKRLTFDLRSNRRKNFSFKSQIENYQKMINKTIINDNEFNKNKKSSDFLNKREKLFNDKFELNDDKSQIISEKNELIQEITNIKNIKYITEYMLLTLTDIESIINPIYENNKRSIYKNNYDLEFPKSINLKECENIMDKHKEIINKENNDPKIFLNDIEIFGDNKNTKYKFGSFRDNSDITYKEAVEKKLDFINIDKMIKSLIKIFEIKLDLIGKKIKIYYNINKIIPEKILSNEKHLKHIIFNLMSNAIKFTNSGKVGIELDYEKENHKLVIKITDTGLGIEPEIIKKLGHSYIKTFQNNNDFGIGMGIYIVKKLVKLLEGEFRIESFLKKGTTIFIKLPYDMKDNNKKIDESEIKKMKNLNSFKRVNNLLNLKLSNIEENSELEIRLKSDIESDINFSKNGKKNILKNNKKKMIYIKPNKLNHSNSLPCIGCLKNFNLKLIKEFYEQVRSIYDNPSINNYEITKEHLKLIFHFFNNFNLNQFTIEKNKTNKETYNMKSLNVDDDINKVSKLKFLSPRKIERHNSSKSYLTLYSKNIEKSDINSIPCFRSFSSSENKNIKLNKNGSSIQNLNEDHTIEVNIEDFIKKKKLKKFERDLPQLNDGLIQSANFSNNKIKLKETKNYYFCSLGQETLNLEKNIINNDNSSTSKSKLEKVYSLINNENSINLLSSSCISNKSIDTTKILEDNIVNKNLLSLKLENPESIFNYKNNMFSSSIEYKIKTLNDNIQTKPALDNEIEIPQNISYKSDKINNDRNFSLKYINKENAYDSYADYQHIALITTFKNNENNDNFHEKDVNTENKYDEFSKISLNINNSKEKKEENSIVTPYLATKIKPNLSNFSNHSSINQLEKSYIDSLSSSLNTNNNLNKKNEEINYNKGNIIDYKFINKTENNFENFKNQKNTDKNIIYENNPKKNLAKHLSEFPDFFVRKNENKDFFQNPEINLNFYRDEEFKLHKNSNISEEEPGNPEINNNTDVLRILVIDDEKLVRRSHIKIISKYMEKNNISFIIEECEDGIECLYKIYKGINDELKYNVIITDETMNFLKGSFMSKILKKLITDKVIDDIKIIMVTSYEAENFVDLQGTILEKIFTKPLSINNLEKIFSLN